MARFDDESRIEMVGSSRPESGQPDSVFDLKAYLAKLPVNSDQDSLWILPELKERYGSKENRLPILENDKPDYDLWDPYFLTRRDLKINPEEVILDFNKPKELYPIKDKMVNGLPDLIEAKKSFDEGLVEKPFSVEEIQRRIAELERRINEEGNK